MMLPPVCTIARRQTEIASCRFTSRRPSDALWDRCGDDGEDYRKNGDTGDQRAPDRVQGNADILTAMTTSTAGDLNDQTCKSSVVQRDLLHVRRYGTGSFTSRPCTQPGLVHISKWRRHAGSARRSRQAIR